MRKRTIVVAAGLVAAVVVGLVAAGWGSGAADSATIGGGASIAPANAAAFVAIDSDVSSTQWKAVDGLLDQLPSYDAVAKRLRTIFEQRTKLSWDDDVKPALGSELDLIVLSGTKPRLVGLTHGGDQAKLDALLGKAGHGIVSKQIDGWTAFAQTQAALDRVTHATTKLAGDATYEAAAAKLADDALVRAYANGADAQTLLSSLHGTAVPTVSAQPLVWASADLVARSDGLLVHAYTQDGPAQRGQPLPPVAITSSLVDEIPSGALFVADIQVTPGTFNFSDPKSLPKPLQQLIASSPSLPSDLNALLGGETVLYVRPGQPIPEVTLVTQPADTSAAEAALADIVKTLEQQMGAAAGAPVVPIVHAVLGGQLIISTSQAGLDAFRSAGPKLSSDPGFEAAQQAAGMPTRTTGFFYANVASLLPLAQLVAPLVGIDLPAGARAGAGAVKTLTAWGTRAGADSSYTALLAIG